MSVLLLRPQPAWNRSGPRIPNWFRAGLRQIDDNLELQYVPAKHLSGQAADAPGIWMVFHRLRRSRFYWPKPVFMLSENGNPIPPAREHLKLIRAARNAKRQGRMDKFLEGMDRLRKESETVTGRQAWEAVNVHVEEILRRMNIRDSMKPQLSMYTGR